MTKLTTAVDCDGILFDANSHVWAVACKVLRRKLTPPTDHQHFEFDRAMNLTPEEWDKVRCKIEQGNPAFDMNWLPGAKDFVNALAQEYDVFFLTSHWRGCESWVTDREARLRTMWPNLDVVFAHNKTRCRFDYLIDDRAENVKAAGTRGLLFDQPWNRHSTHWNRFLSYNELLAYLQTAKAR